MSEEQEREHFSHWIATAMPFDANVGMVEHSIKTDAAWLGWMARAASEAFREVLARDAHTNPSRHPKPPQLSSGAELEKLAIAAGMYSCLNQGSGSCVFSVCSPPCAGVSQEHLERFAELVRADERLHCIEVCEAQRLTYEVGTNAELAYGEGVDACSAALKDPQFMPRLAQAARDAADAKYCERQRTGDPQPEGGPIFDVFGKYWP